MTFDFVGLPMVVKHDFLFDLNRFYCFDGDSFNSIDYEDSRFGVWVATVIDESHIVAEICRIDHLRVIQPHHIKPSDVVLMIERILHELIEVLT